MAVNPNIALSFQAPKIESPINMMAQMQQLQHCRRAQQQETKGPLQPQLPGEHAH